MSEDTGISLEPPVSSRDKGEVEIHRKQKNAASSQNKDLLIHICRYNIVI